MRGDPHASIFRPVMSEPIKSARAPGDAALLSSHDEAL